MIPSVQKTKPQPGRTVGLTRAPQTRVPYWLFGLLLLSLLAPSLAGAGNGIKERMLERLPTINALKKQGVVGENNRGLLEYLGSAQPQKELIAAENADRLTVYRAIAAKQQTTPALVAGRRARQIANNAPPGTMLQDEHGAWYQKK